jgi:hypothetical protein
MVRDDFNHLLHCKAATTEVTMRHTMVRKVLADFCRVCVGVEGEVLEERVFERRGELSACRIDIIVKTALGETFYVDTTVVNPGAKKYVYGDAGELINARAGSSYIQGYAAETRSALKQRDHLQRLDPAQLAGFVPFAVETSGRMGQAAVAFLQTMEQCHNARVGDAGPGAMRKRRAWFDLELGMAVARGTAKVLVSSRAKLHHRRDVAQVVADDVSFDDEEGPPYDYRLANAVAGGVRHSGNVQEYQDGLVVYGNEEVNDDGYQQLESNVMEEGGVIGVERLGHELPHGGLGYEGNEAMHVDDYQQLEPDLAAGGGIMGERESAHVGNDGNENALEYQLLEQDPAASDELPHRGLGYGGDDDYQLLELDPAAGGGIKEGEFGYELYMYFQEAVAVEDEMGGPRV